MAAVSSGNTAALAGILQRELLAVAQQAARVALDQLHAEAPVFQYGDALSQANEAAEDWAKQHAAELVTGINQTTRDGIRDEVLDAIDTGASVDELADDLSAGFGFSDDRADMIARTELAYANVQGNIEGWRSTGIVDSKKWIVAQDEFCSACEQMHGEVVPLEDDFATPDGDLIPGPPLHPNCRCDVVAVMVPVGDTQEGFADEETEKGYNPDQPRDDQGRFGEGGGGKPDTFAQRKVREWLAASSGPVRVFHGTRSDLVARIRKEGLTVNGAKGNRVYGASYYQGGREGSVFVAGNRDTARLWADLAAYRANKDRGKGGRKVSAAVIEIRLPRAEARKLVADEVGNSLDVRYSGTIKPEWIVAVRKGADEVTLFVVVLAEDETEKGSDQPRADDKLRPPKTKADAEREAHGWVGVDLDGTLAMRSDDPTDFSHGFIGEPVPAMVARVRAWLAEGREVRIVTARANGASPATMAAIRAWVIEHVGVSLVVTAEKDHHMAELWDDRAVQVRENTGQRVGKGYNPDQPRDDRGRFGEGDAEIAALHEKANELRAMSQDERDNLDVFDFGFHAYVLYEAQEMMPKKEGGMKGVNDRNSFTLYQECDAVANIGGKPYLAVKEEDPDGEDTGDPDTDAKVWAFFPADRILADRFQASTADRADAIAEFKEHLAAQGQARKYDESQPRDEGGRWTAGGSGGDESDIRPSEGGASSGEPASTSRGSGRARVPDRSYKLLSQFKGGEPTIQPDMPEAVVAACKAETYDEHREASDRYQAEALKASNNQDWDGARAARYAMQAHDRAAAALRTGGPTDENLRLSQAARQASEYAHQLDVLPNITPPVMADSNGTLAPYAYNPRGDSYQPEGFRSANNIKEASARLKSLGMDTAGVPTINGLRTKYEKEGYGKNPDTKYVVDAYTIAKDDGPARLDFMNQLLAEVHDLNERFPKIEKILSDHDRVPRITTNRTQWAGGIFDPETLSICVGGRPQTNDDHRFSNPSYSSDPNRQVMGSADGTNIGDILRHELGHAVDSAFVPAGAKPHWANAESESARFRSALRESMKHTGHKSEKSFAKTVVSTYASTNNVELWAEAFCMYTSRGYGNHGTPMLPPPLENYFKGLLGR